MVKLTFDNLLPSAPPTDGWKIEYRILGSLGAYVSAGPFLSYPIIINTTDPAGTLYEGNIWRDCGALESTKLGFTTNCRCAATYTPTADGLRCQKTESIPATVTSSNYCFQAAQNANYSTYGTRVYTPGYTNADIQLPIATPPGGHIQAVLVTPGQWLNNTSNSSIGPMNRDSVWIDSDCNGVLDALAGGTKLTLGFNYNNVGAARQIYIGVGGDNEFNLKFNGAEIAKTSLLGVDSAFKIWHMVPVTLLAGINYFNLEGLGDGSVNDAIGMAVYDSTYAQLSSAIADTDLNMLFKSRDLRTTHLDVASCPVGYNLDTSGGVGNYVCRRTLYKVCNSADS